MDVLATQYVRESIATTPAKFSRSAHIRRITDYPFLQHELSADFMEFVICCQREQFEELQMFEYDHQLVLDSVTLAEAATVQWYKDYDFSKEEQHVCTVQHTTQVVVNNEVIAADQNATPNVDGEIPCLKNAQDTSPVVVEESTSLKNEEGQPLLQINVEPFDANIAARLAAQEATQREMQHQITSLVDSQSEIKNLLALILARQQPPNS
ncbi:hypothetical protein TSUD_400630 [Trifolium subterraneum]|uniref:Uncharacterized protein n=1 Tax=Trifolium subterraneum TaxID=3900 RepID=A0A2Z6P9B1_TRISU|nr:hypothetical protein TSUD_400630 [Trifolium subterraneum]